MQWEIPDGRCISLIGSCFVNIILDVVLVAVLRMGVAGAALATISSQLFSAILVILCLTRTQDMYKVEGEKSVLTAGCCRGSYASVFRRECSL